MADVFSKKKRSAIMSLIRGKHTKPEKAIKALLRENGIRYRSHAKQLPGTPDVILPAQRTAIFINGCFWHGHYCRRSKIPSSNVEFWKKKISRNVRRDQASLRRLRKLKWRAITYWTCKKPLSLISRLK